MKKIFIASCSDDQSIRLVGRELLARGHRPIVYDIGRVYAAATPFETVLDKDGHVNLWYDKYSFRPAEIGAAWYRRPNILPYHVTANSSQRAHIQRNIRALHDGIFATFAEKAWLNDPFVMRKAEGKLYQLTLANAVGFVTPPTVITNSWNSVLQLPAGKVIVKMPYAVLQNDSEPDKMLFTTILQNKRTKLPTDALPFPAIWQPYKQKAREWRVTVVGDHLFTASIYTSEGAKHDWREYQHDKGKVRFCAEEFPEDEKQKCFDLLKALGLRYGAFDFIETPEGEIIFLEINPNGQYGWLEEELGFPISAAIATELIRILTKKK